MKGAHLLANLHPQFGPLVRELIEEAESWGIQVTVTSGYRSVQEQERVCAELRARERRDGRKYPCATPGLSAHQYGLAVDMVGGKSLDSREHALLVELAVSWGFARVANDPPHFEHPGWRRVYPQVRERVLGRR